MQGERRDWPHRDAVELDRRLLEGIARQLETVTRRSRPPVELEAERVQLEPVPAVLLVGDADLELQAAVLAVEVEGLARRGVAPSFPDAAIIKAMPGTAPFSVFEVKTGPPSSTA